LCCFGGVLCLKRSVICGENCVEKKQREEKFNEIKRKAEEEE